MSGLVGLKSPLLSVADFIWVGESEEEAIEDLKDRQEKRTEVFTDFTKLEIFKTPEMRWKMACCIS